MTDHKEVEDIDASTYAGKAIKACRTKARGIMGDDLLTFMLIDFVSFIMLSNKFMDKGIFITEENREDSYIKIIETGDDQLIAELERYINLQDKMIVVEKKKEEYEEIVQALRNLNDYNDESAVNTIVESYLRR